jgi:hypothetical protein
VIGVDGALDLVDLLVVLVGPHVGGEGGGEGVEGDAFEAVAVGGVAGQGQQQFERVEGFDHGAEFGALDRVAAGETLVAGEHAGGLAVVAVEDLEHAGGEGAVIGLAGQAPGPGRSFEGHAGVDHMFLPGPEAAARGGGGDILAGVIGAVIEALVVEFAGEIEQPGLAGLFVGVVGGDEAFEPAELAPAEERGAVEGVEGGAEVAEHRLEDGVVAGGLVVLDEDFVGEEDGPEIVGFGAGVGGVGGVPAVGALVATMWRRSARPWP